MRHLDSQVPGGYSKTDLDFRRYEDTWQDAVRRAKRLALAVGKPA
ncbi:MULTISPECIES: hypothetical protein [unclassified Streptomyces]|nr:hypothetical protein [Streptomyces sp. NBC_01429]